jgi:hypothetical protein
VRGRGEAVRVWGRSGHGLAIRRGAQCYEPRALFVESRAPLAPFARLRLTVQLTHRQLHLHAAQRSTAQLSSTTHRSITDRCAAHATCLLQRRVETARHTAHVRHALGVCERAQQQMQVHRRL